MPFHRNTFADLIPVTIRENLENIYAPRVPKEDAFPDQVDYHETRNKLENDREDKYVNPNLYGIPRV